MYSHEPPLTPRSASNIMNTHSFRKKINRIGCDRNFRRFPGWLVGLQEHFMVYNRRHPTEQYRISLKLTSGALRMFFLSPGSKNAYPFWTLEDKITTFLQVNTF